MSLPFCNRLNAFCTSASLTAAAAGKPALIFLCILLHGRRRTAAALRAQHQEVKQCTEGLIFQRHFRRQEQQAAESRARSAASFPDRVSAVKRTCCQATYRP